MSNIQKQHKISPAIAWLTIQKFIIFYCPLDGEHTIFDMFYSGANQIADSRRSLGLGLSLCKSIINAHGGELTVSDNLPHGTVFTFTLPAGEVKVYE